MKKVIVDYKKLTPEVLTLLTEKFPDGYGDDDIIKFDNHHNETIEAVEIKTEDAIYLVKVSSKLHYTMTNFDSDSFEVNELGNVIVGADDKIIPPTILRDEEE
ncbi:hypothetical protein APS56_02090 [Pseudalgibacter alginicilyticus]|uniref:Uncharacterized protein n=1 Tax=Pseudalgibacter alginicilyticus TaxID=1736674 RepID=A0A0P0CDK4_9FLAO|nr:hypothetical protein [Pseudalgibacter alginicilyticus]ALJ04016.1 hypothetical protein APS56_02090 [Pseudalgibacter alginicilyticus]